MAVNYSVVVQAELDLKKIKEQLKEVSSNGVDLKVHGAAQGKKEIDDVTKSTRQLNETGQDLELTFNVAHEVFSKFLSVVKDMAGQVYELDDALTEFKKVSDLSGSALDDYVDKLSQLGQEVGRTGKPNRSEPVCCDGKAAQRTAPKPLKASRALSLQHEDEICLSVIINNELVRKQKDDKDDSMVEKPKEFVINNV